MPHDTTGSDASAPELETPARSQRLSLLLVGWLGSRVQAANGLKFFRLPGGSDSSQVTVSR